MRTENDLSRLINDENARNEPDLISIRGIASFIQKDRKNYLVFACK